MNNREWLNDMDDEEFASYFSAFGKCFLCAYRTAKKGTYCQSSKDCFEGIKKWLQQGPLKPCPICRGGSEVIYEGEICAIRCKKCHLSSDWFPTIKEAAQAWNIRVGDDT